MSSLSSYVGHNAGQMLQPLGSILLDELKKNRQEVASNIAHIQLAAKDEDSAAMHKACADVGMSADECNLLQKAICDDIEYCQSHCGEASPRDTFYGDRWLKAVYANLKVSKHLLDVVTLIGDLATTHYWRLAECKFAVRLFTTKMFNGQRSFYGAIEQKFADVVAEIAADCEPCDARRTVYVLREHAEQCKRQFAQLRVERGECCFDKSYYVIDSVECLTRGFSSEET